MLRDNPDNDSLGTVGRGSSLQRGNDSLGAVGGVDSLQRDNDSLGAVGGVSLILGSSSTSNLNLLGSGSNEEHPESVEAELERRFGRPIARHIRSTLPGFRSMAAYNALQARLHARFCEKRFWRACR